MRSLRRIWNRLFWREHVRDMQNALDMQHRTRDTMNAVLGTEWTTPRALEEYNKLHTI